MINLQVVPQGAGCACWLEWAWRWPPRPCRGGQHPEWSTANEDPAPLGSAEQDSHSGRREMHFYRVYAVGLGLLHVAALRSPSAHTGTQLVRFVFDGRQKWTVLQGHLFSWAPAEGGSLASRAATAALPSALGPAPSLPSSTCPHRSRPPWLGGSWCVVSPSPAVAGPPLGNHPPSLALAVLVW